MIIKNSFFIQDRKKIKDTSEKQNIEQIMKEKGEHKLC